MATDFEATLAAATARGSNIVPGVVLSAITRDGKPLYNATSGHHGLSPTAAPIAADATFWLASCTKLATSIAALQCVERGLLTLDEPVSPWLPELASPQIASLDDDDDSNDANSLRLAPAAGAITLRHLLTHTSGFAYEWLRPALAAWRARTGTDAKALAGTVTALYDVPLVGEPGRVWAYGPGVDWAGVLVERLNGGATLGECLQREVFGRLGGGGGGGGGGVGRSTTFRLDSAAAREARVRERLVPNAMRLEDGTLVEKSFGYSEDVKQDAGGAGWYSSVPDYMVILQDLLAEEPRLLRRENVEEWLFKGHITDKGALHQLLQARTGMTPQEGADVHGAPMNYSLGGLIWVQDGDVLPKGTLTWGGLPNLKWFANRDKGLAAMYASQVTPPVDPQSQELASQFFKEVWRLYNAGEGTNGAGDK